MAKKLLPTSYHALLPVDDAKHNSKPHPGTIPTEIAPSFFWGAVGNRAYFSAPLLLRPTPCVRLFRVLLPPVSLSGWEFDLGGVASIRSRGRGPSKNLKYLCAVPTTGKMSWNPPDRRSSLELSVATADICGSSEALCLRARGEREEDRRRVVV